MVINFAIYLCCLGGASNSLRERIQEILDEKDEYFDSKGMKWTVCSDTDFPYWIELHIQSQFEMRLQEGKRKISRKNKDTKIQEGHTVYRV